MAAAIFKPAREGVHAADVRVEQVHRLEALAADLGVEVRAAGLEAAHLRMESMISVVR